MELLVQLSGKFASVICNVFLNKYLKFAKLRSFLKIRMFFLKTLNKIEPIHVDSESTINSFEFIKIFYLIIY